MSDRGFRVKLPIGRRAEHVGADRKRRPVLDGAFLVLREGSVDQDRRGDIDSADRRQCDPESEVPTSGFGRSIFTDRCDDIVQRAFDPDLPIAWPAYAVSPSATSQLRECLPATCFCATGLRWH